MNHALMYIGAGVSGKPAEAVRAAKNGCMIEGLFCVALLTKEGGRLSEPQPTINYQAQMNRCACTR